MPYEEPHGFIFNGNGTYVGPNYGNAAPFSAPAPISSWDTTNPTARAQAFYAPPPPQMQYAPMPQMQGGGPRFTPPQFADSAGISGPTPPGIRQPNPQAPAHPGLSTPLPVQTMANGWPVPRPSAEMTGPHGRTMQMVAGTPFQSAEERDWFYSQLQNQYSMNSARFPQAPQGPTRTSYSGPTSGGQPFTPPGTGNAGLAGDGLQGYATQTAQSAGLDPTVFRNLIQHESGWNPDAVNPTSGAAGLGQFLPSTAAKYGATPQMLRQNPQYALDLSTRMVAELKNYYNGNEPQAYAAYFIGPGNIDSAIRAGGPNGWLPAADAIATQYGQGTVSQYLRAIGAI